MTFRPEFAPPWTGQAHVTTVTLISARSARRSGLVERVGRERRASGRDYGEIVDRTDGIPLFVEELTKAAWKPVCTTMMVQRPSRRRRVARLLFRPRFMLR